MGLKRALSEDLDGGWQLWGCEAGSAGLHDAALMPGDFFNGIAQHGCVIDSQTCDAGDGGPDEDVGAVVFTADAAFNYSRIDSLAHVGMIGHQG